MRTRERVAAFGHADARGNKKQTGDPTKRKEADAKALQEKIAVSGFWPAPGKRGGEWEREKRECLPLLTVLPAAYASSCRTPRCSPSVSPWFSFRSVPS